MLPKLIAPVQNRLTISLAGSTISSGIGLRPALISNRPRSVQSCRLSSLEARGELLVAGEVRLLEGVLELLDRLGVPHVMLAPAAPHHLAADVELRAVPDRTCSGRPTSMRCSDSRAMVSRPIPSIRLGVPGK